jgi:hypothetical protein
MNAAGNPEMMFAPRTTEMPFPIPFLSMLLAILMTPHAPALQNATAAAHAARDESAKSGEYLNAFARRVPLTAAIATARIASSLSYLFLPVAQSFLVFSRDGNTIVIC